MNNRIIIPAEITDGPTLMEFKLTFAGRLGATQRDPLPGQPPKHTQDRRSIRRAVHVQMKRLWQEHPALNDSDSHHPPYLLVAPTVQPPEPIATTVEQLANRHAMYGFNFVPLVTDQLDLLCNIDILMLRPDNPGGVWAGDIDNRVKTLLDALRVPEPGEDYVNLTPQEDEQPFYCLLQDDKLITGLSVDTDRLLEPVHGEYNAGDVRLIITVTIKPYVLHSSNMRFG